jgi:phosphate transport system protein
MQAMCDQVYAALGLLKQHLVKPDKEELMKVILLDNEVDSLEKTIDEKILYIFATQQPLGHDLREAYASVKIAHQIERIGDAVESLARQLSSGEAQSADKNRYIERLLVSSMQLFRMTYRAMFENEFTPVVDIYVQDDAVDALHKELFQYAKRMLGNSSSDTDVEIALQFISIGSKLEKIADISCNWAEQIDFLMHGIHRRKITKRPQRIILADHHGGVLASLVANTLNIGVAGSIELTLATTSQSQHSAELNHCISLVLEAKGYSPEVYPIGKLEALNWERALLIVYLGSELHREQRKTKNLKGSHKTVDLFWPEIEIDFDPTRASDVEKLVAVAERKAEPLRSLLSRIQRPRNE